MNRSGWTPEQIELRRRLEKEGHLPPYDVDDEESEVPSDEYMPEDEYWDQDALMGGEGAGSENADGGRAAPIAPKRNRSGEKELKKVVPRRPMPSPPQKAPSGGGRRRRGSEERARGAHGSELQRASTAGPRPGRRGRLWLQGHHCGPPPL
eukprot:5155385-Alexandrium_andersonii.AAC.1